jgi:hypothetical protein
MTVAVHIIVNGITVNGRWRNGIETVRRIAQLAPTSPRVAH